MATPTAAISEFQVGWAALIARAQNKASPELIQSWLRVDPHQAQEVMQQLVTRGITRNPVAGVASAAKPMYEAGKAPGAFGGPKDLAKKALDYLAEDQTERPPTAPDADAAKEAAPAEAPTEDLSR